MIPRARVKYFKQENYYVFIGINTNLPRDLFFGNFGTIEHNSTYYMYGLDKYDQELVKDIKLKQNEIIVRVDTDRTRERKISNLVKINMDKFLVYFNEVDDLGDDSISFAPRGVKIDYINLFDGYESKLLEEVKNITKPMKHVFNFEEFLTESVNNNDVKDIQKEINLIVKKNKNLDYKKKETDAFIHWEIGKKDAKSFKVFGYDKKRDSFYLNGHAGTIENPDTSTGSIWYSREGFYEDKPNGWYSFSKREILHALYDLV